MIDRQALEAAVAGAEPPELLALAGELQGRAWGRLAPAPSKAEATDASITVAEAALRLGVSKDYIYKNKSLPFVSTIGRRVVCSGRGVEKYLASRRGAYGSR
jgi:excisionase family DNA binding protein